MKWEYMYATVSWNVSDHFVFHIDGENVKKPIKLKDFLSDSGKHGWELVAFSDTLWVFKKQM